MKIQDFSLKLIGSFNYDPAYLEENISGSGFEAAEFYRDSLAYLNQKYYTNWLHSIFWASDKLRQNGLSYLESNHLKLVTGASVLNQSYVLNCDDDGSEVKLEFRISSVEVLLLRENMGVFFLGIHLDKKHYNWRDISLFTSNIRRTSVYHPEERLPILVDVIEKYITPIFHPVEGNWRQFLPQLKSVLLVDVDERPDDQTLNRLLYDLATFSMPLEKNPLYDTEYDYFENQINQNALSIFTNWRTLCLEDSMVRVAVNLVEEDRYKLWENEYIFIYLYVLFARHYLYNCNARLGQVSAHEKLIRQTRNNYFEFMNEFEFTRISYKFLPNAIFQQIKRSLQIDDEIHVVEKEIDRINTLFKEQSDIRLGRIILGLTVVTLISVAFDLGQLVTKLTDPTMPSQQALYLSTALSVVLAFGAFVLWVFWWKRR